MAVPKKLTAIITILISLHLAGNIAGAKDFKSDWQNDPARIWVGPDYWANRLGDWQLANSRLECTESRAEKPFRTIHLLTRRLGSQKASFQMKLRAGLINKTDNISPDCAAGFLLGAGPNLDYRAAALVHHSLGPDAGIIAAAESTGRAVFRDMTAHDYAILVAGEMPKSTPTTLDLHLTAKPTANTYQLNLEVYDAETSRLISSATLDNVNPARLVGSVALLSHPGSGKTTGRFWFDNWRLTGRKFQTHEDRNCGPILSTQYTLSKNILKLTAQMMPLGPQDTQTVQLQSKKNWKWQTIASAQIDPDAYTATFRVENWDSKKSTPYRVVYDLKKTDGSDRTYTYSGTIRRDPVDKKVISVAGFTGNHNVRRPGIDSGFFGWTTDELWFPHTDIVNHVAKQNIDVLSFSGDQVREWASSTFIETSPLESMRLDYLYKWYLWCWAFRDLTRDIPSVCIPDDHDVYQSNIWGAGGRKTKVQDAGGYTRNSEWVKMVERTQTSHLPDPYDPTPIEQGIGVYYCDMTYGRISFAVLEDRKFKSGPIGMLPKIEKRADYITDPNFDRASVDVPGAKLLGDRQLNFIRDWAANWRGADFKIALSQTVFANAASLHGGTMRRIVADLDSNGWPQTPRNNALRELRKAFAFMLCGDQHLATIVHHGIDTWEDAGFSMCVPSVANFYPRAWAPLEPGKNRPPNMPEYTGRFLDGFGNHITVWAATNPKTMSVRPAELHDSMPGYGVIRLDKQTRDITIECWPRFADPTNPKHKQYLGWPKTINQLDNYARKPAGFLPTINITGITNPVVQVIYEAKDEIVYTLRIKGSAFTPMIFESGRYTVIISDPDTDELKTLKNLTPTKEKRTINIDF